MASGTQQPHDIDMWGDRHRKVASPREFLVTVDLYLPGPTTLRKPSAPPRKKSERRLSAGGSSRPPKDDGRRVKEKPSWIGFSKEVSSSAASGQWRPAACKLMEDEDACILNIYVEETILTHSVYIHLLRCTDIRPADRSLFLRNDCLGIHCVEGQRRTAGSTSEPIYLQFSDSNTMHIWLSLLRSYATCEVYGRRVAPADGGLYRMWRQVSMTVAQGRNIGSLKPFDSQGNSVYMGETEQDQVDMDLYCELLFNGTLCARTTVKKGIGAPEWHENFVFPDLPPFGELVVNVWREKKLQKAQLLGSILIALGNFRRGEMVEGWFPVLSGAPWANGIHVGDVRLKLKVEEEIILPSVAYNAIAQTMMKHNYLELVSDLESRTRSDGIANNVIAVAIANNVLLPHIFQALDKEVDGTPSSHTTLFRGNTTLTKSIELTMSWYGADFLEASVGPIIRRICTEKVALEVDPTRSGKTGKDLDKAIEQLVYWCREFWDGIYAGRRECPQELRKIFEYVRQLVEKRYKVKEDPTNPKNQNLPWQSVSAFCFLRFIVPAILHPHLFGLSPGLPSPPVQRSLTLIAKVMQSLANLNTAVQKEEFMRGVKDFMSDSVPAMIDYIFEVSTPLPDAHGTASGSSNKHDRLHTLNSLRQRSVALPTLHREALPLLPHLVDVPKHLAILISAVVRSSKVPQARPAAVGGEAQVDAFSSECLSVEAHAMQRVAQLAVRAPRSSKRPTTAPANRSTSDSRLRVSEGRASIDTMVRPSAVRSSTNPETPRNPAAKAFTPFAARSRTLSRPSTAPTGSDTSPALQGFLKPQASQPELKGSKRSRKQSRPSTAPSSSDMQDTTGRFGSNALAVQTFTTPQRGSVDRGLTFTPKTDSSIERLGSPLASAVSVTDDATKKRKGFLRGFLGRM